MITLTRVTDQKVTIKKDVITAIYENGPLVEVWIGTHGYRIQVKEKHDDILKMLT